MTSFGTLSRARWRALARPMSSGTAQGTVSVEDGLAAAAAVFEFASCPPDDDDDDDGGELAMTFQCVFFHRLGVGDTNVLLFRNGPHQPEMI